MVVGRSNDCSTPQLGVCSQHLVTGNGLLMKKVIALETSALRGSVAAFDGNNLLAAANLESTQRSAQSLLPALKLLLSDVGWSPSEVELICVCQGPGSFTGLRVGITAAKTMAYAVGCEVLGVNTLQVIAAQVETSQKTICATLDAQRGDLFSARFARSAEEIVVTTQETQIISADQWIDQLDTSLCLTGPGLKKIVARIPASCELSDASSWSPQAETLARVGWQQYQAGQRCDLWSLAPNYFRKSAAEEKLEQT